MMEAFGEDFMGDLAGDLAGVLATGALETFAVAAIVLEPAFGAAASFALEATTLFVAGFASDLGAADLAFLDFAAVTDFFDDAMTGHSYIVPGWSRNEGGSDTQLPFGAERRPPSARALFGRCRLAICATPKSLFENLSWCLTLRHNGETADRSGALT